VIAVDTNILVYAHRADADWHEPAVRAVAGLAEGTPEWAIPWPCLHEFLAVVTHPRIFKTPTPAKLAFAQIDAWLESPALVVLSENDDYVDALRDLVLAAKVGGARVHDARVAALCVSHSVRELWTADRDFSLFTAIKTRNPLAATKSIR
jgi:toxin-antitoxin system PIN domain toxin